MHRDRRRTRNQGLNILHYFCPTTLALALLPDAGAAQATDAPTDAAPLVNGSSVPLPPDELRTFAEVLDQVKVVYVEPVGGKTLLENTVKSILNNLDPHSAYLDLEDFAELQESTNGEFGGLGTEVGGEDDFIKVVSSIDDTPTARAGIQPGDLIIRINGKSTKGQSMTEAINSMRGKAGSPITLTIVRGGDRSFDVELKCVIVEVKGAKSQVLEPGYVYLRIIQSQVNTSEEVVKALSQPRKDNKGRLKGLVLDLRNNPGGMLQSTVEVTDAFLTKGLIVYTKGYVANSELRFNADPTDPSSRIPLVMLINGGSAPAAEIVAGTLQDQRHAILADTSSFGKGSVRTMLSLSNDRALELTTALYYTPNGRSIQAQGIVPDIEVGRTKVTQERSSFEDFKEADLQGYLANDSGGADHPTGERAAPSKRPQDSDYQLNQTLSLLKGLSATRSD